MIKVHKREAPIAIHIDHVPFEREGAIKLHINLLSDSKTGKIHKDIDGHLYASCDNFPNREPVEGNDENETILKLIESLCNGLKIKIISVKKADLIKQRRLFNHCVASCFVLGIILYPGFLYCSTTINEFSPSLIFGLSEIFKSITIIVWLIDAFFILSALLWIVLRAIQFIRCKITGKWEKIEWFFKFTYTSEDREVPRHFYRSDPLNKLMYPEFFDYDREVDLKRWKF